MGAHMIIPGVGVIKHIHIVVHAGLRGQSAENAVFRAEAVLIVVGIRHCNMVQLALDGAAEGTKAESLIDLFGSQTQ